MLFTVLRMELGNLYLWVTKVQISAKHTGQMGTEETVLQYYRWIGKNEYVGDIGPSTRNTQELIGRWGRKVICGVTVWKIKSYTWVI